jgi:hypothetical protein
MRISRKVVSASVVLLLSGVGVGAGSLASPAAAGTRSDTSRYGTLTVSDVTITGGCGSTQVRFAPAADLVDWNLGVSAKSVLTTDPAIHLAFDPEHLTRTLTLCAGRNGTGGYRVDGYLTGNLGESAPDLCCEVADGYDTFLDFRVINRRPTTLTVKVARSHSKSCPLGQTKHCSRVTGKLLGSGKPLTWEYVQIQAYKRGKWVRQAWGRTDGLGRASWYVVITKKERNLKFRLYFPVQDYAKASASRAFKVKY